MKAYYRLVRAALPGAGLAALLLLGSPALAAARQRVAGPSAAAARTGGVALVLQADGADFGRARAETMESSIVRRMAAEGIFIADVSATGARLSFRVREAARAGRALRIARAAGLDDGAAGGWDARLAGGNRIVMREMPASRARAIGQAMDSAREVVARRIAALGPREASTVRQGADRLIVRVAGVRNPAAVRALIIPTARLEFRLVDTNVTPEQLALGRAPAGSQILPYAEGSAGEPRPRIAVQRRAIITGDMIASAGQSLESYSGRPVVNIRFSEEGRRRFAQATRENVGRPFAIVLDDVVISAPNIHEPILGGTAQISGNFTVESANRFATWLGSGALPIKLVVVEERGTSRRRR